MKLRRRWGKFPFPPQAHYTWHTWNESKTAAPSSQSTSLELCQPKFCRYNGIQWGGICVLLARAPTHTLTYTLSLSVSIHTHMEIHLGIGKWRVGNELLSSTVPVLLPFSSSLPHHSISPSYQPHVDWSFFTFPHSPICLHIIPLQPHPIPHSSWHCYQNRRGQTTLLSVDLYIAVTL